MTTRGVMGAHLGMSWGVLGEDGWRKGPWTAEEDRLLIEYVKLHGEGRWNSVARLAGLRRNGKSCRLRWVNYLRPDLKRGQITPHEERIILDLHARWGNRWSTIARSLPGRTDNEIKNYWRTHFKKKEKDSSSNPERAKTRLLRKQQFQQQFKYQQQQQQQQQQEQHQQQQQQFTTMDMKRIMSLLLDENDTKVTTNLAQARPPEIATNNVYPTTCTPDEQGIYSLMLRSDISTMEGYNEELLSWDAFWNLDDFQGNNWNAF